MLLQTLLHEREAADIMGLLPGTINVYPLAKLMLATVESALKVKVACSLQALICMLVQEDRVQVGRDQHPFLSSRGGKARFPPYNQSSR